ncbi:hypothetical protein HKD24_06675 [Gluconobacter sp. LMG 31484]|uniref:Uncharacterized protein n=1 Tax=Gluconobacter vitians TaxID=2728102 RepID=A0ABR9Y5J1_9PROT|nr:hypothetical protein [Gluconobacter vitians]MBF0858898.1 hypothetical protein [Gluconobacter vitians]
MTNEAVSALKAAVGRWVYRKDASSHPSLLTNSDIHDLAIAVKAGLAGPVSAEGEREWGNLRELTKNWIVQQKLGVKPGPLQAHDFEHLASVISPVLPVSEPAGLAVTPVVPDAQPDSAIPVQSDVELWAHEAADLAFAREHLECCL